MPTQLLIGTFAIIGTVMIQSGFIGVLYHWLKKWQTWFSDPAYSSRLILGVNLIVIWLVVGLTTSAWLWSGIYIILGAFESLEPALYFSVVTFTTLGYGDITLNAEWRLLASLTAVNGLIIVGLNTGVLVDTISKISPRTEID